MIIPFLEELDPTHMRWNNSECPQWPSYPCQCQIENPDPFDFYEDALGG